MKISEGKVEREVRLKWEKLDYRTDFNHMLNLIYTHTHPHTPLLEASITLRINTKTLNKAYRALPVSAASPHAPSPALSALVTPPFSFLSKQGPQLLSKLFLSSEMFLAQYPTLLD